MGRGSLGSLLLWFPLERAAEVQIPALRQVQGRLVVNSHFEIPIYNSRFCAVEFEQVCDLLVVDGGIAVGG
jgi:hypothetical protein